MKRKYRCANNHDFEAEGEEVMCPECGWIMTAAEALPDEAQRPQARGRAEETEGE